MSKRPAGNPEPSGAPQPANNKGALGAVVLHHTVTALMLVLILALGVWAYLTFRKTSFFQPPDARAHTRVDAYALLAQRQRIRFALGVYFRLDGRYPRSLDELVQRGLLLPSDLYYPAGEGHFRYRRTASGYALEIEDAP